MIKHEDASVTLTKEEVDWINENFQGGTHIYQINENSRYIIIDNEGDVCGWGNVDNTDLNKISRHRQFMDDFTSLSD